MRWGIIRTIAWVCVCLAAHTGARAQEIRPSKDPVVFTADQVTYNEELGIVVASGNVEFAQGERVLQADTVTYNQKTNIVTATGNVSLLGEGGEVVFANYIEITDDLKNGIIKDIGLLLSDRSRLAGAGGRIQGGTKREIRKGVYSPCELCQEDKSAAPLWQVKAVEVVHDTETKEVVYKDAWLEVAGVPVAYTPYLSHPDPTVTRKSGFLVPTYGSDSQLGLLVQTPYFFNLAPDKDLTVSPMFMTDERPAIGGEYRQRFSNGFLQTSGSYTYVDSTPPNGLGPSTNYSRGHFFAKGLWDIDPTWRAGFNGGYTSDDTYMRLYRISSQPMIVTRPFVEGFRGNNYASMQGYYFRGLRQQDDEKTSPIVAPLMDYNFVGNADSIGGRWFGNGNLMLLTRQEGADSHRLSSQVGYTRPYTTTRGDVWTTTLVWQNDVYNVDNVTPTTEPGTVLSGWTGRSLPQARLDWKYPFVREMGRFRQIIEPVVSFIAAPNGGNPMKIPGEDTGDFEFDDTNLFNTNRLGGLDQVESSQRVIYGLKAMALGNYGGRSELFFGQSYRVTRDVQLFQNGSGLEDNLSDYVGRLRISPSQYFDTLYRFRFDHTDLTPEYQEIGAYMGPRAFRINTSYLYFRDNTLLNQTGSSQQIATGLTSQMTKHVSARAAMVRNLAGIDEGPLSYSFGVTYEDECFLFDASAARSYAVDRDFIPKNTFLFRLVFKTLGEVHASGSAANQ